MPSRKFSQRSLNSSRVIIGRYSLDLMTSPSVFLECPVNRMFFIMLQTLVLVHLLPSFVCIRHSFKYRAILPNESPSRYLANISLIVTASSSFMTYLGFPFGSYFRSYPKR